jgi:hypothetical protein
VSLLPVTCRQQGHLGTESIRSRIVHPFTGVSTSLAELGKSLCSSTQI